MIKILSNLSTTNKGFTLKQSVSQQLRSFLLIASDYGYGGTRDPLAHNHVSHHFYFLSLFFLSDQIIICKQKAFTIIMI